MARRATKKTSSRRTSGRVFKNTKRNKTRFSNHKYVNNANLRVNALKNALLSGYLNMTLREKMIYKLQNNTIDLRLAPLEDWEILKLELLSEDVEEDEEN